MVLEIDVSKMKARVVELQAELDKLNAMISLAELYGKPAVEAVVTEPKTFKLPKTAETQRGMTPGLRRAVTLALFTGPATLYDLSRALAWEPQRVQQTLSSMFKAGLVSMEGNKMKLTDEGKVQAAWFQSHSDRLTYAPNGKGGNRTAHPTLANLLKEA